MIDHIANHLALRNRALTLSVATTGSITMAATTTGYTRTPIAGSGTLAASAGTGTFSTSQAGVIVNGSIVTVAGTNYVVSNFNGTTGCTLSGSPTFTAAAFTYTGSFIVDGLYEGMEIVPTGFSANTVGTIKSVTARTITASFFPGTGTRTVESSASGRTLAVGFPLIRAWENQGDVAFTGTVGRLYISEQYSPSTHSMELFPANGSHANETGMYILKVFGITGTDLHAIGRYISGLAALFAPGTVIGQVHIRTDVAPVPGELIPQPGGWTVCALPIHWAAQSVNTIAA